MFCYRSLKVQGLSSDMAWLFGICLLLFLHSQVILGQNEHSITAEYRLRRKLLSQYDRMVRPVLKPSDVINVTFKVDFKALSEVNNKDQVVTTDIIITQIWNNPFLQWKPVDYEGIKQILMDPKEIWVPDIVLENNADELVIQAGHLEKFRSFVLVRNSGENMWVSPATFKSSCNLNVEFFPFDKQKCSMMFRSLTADSSLLNMLTTNIESDNPEEELKLTTQNGYWSLRSMVIKTKEADIIGRKFREVVVSFFIGRRPMFFVLFSIVPCMIIGLLTLVSFFIPAESGERIGLCATIMLAVSVYLLVVTEQLPEQSETLPVIGVYYLVIMFEIGLALAATVMVLKAHHATSQPPKILVYLTVFNRFVFCGGRRRRHKFPSSPPSPAHSEGGVENPGVPTEEAVVQLADAERKTQRRSVAGVETEEVDVELADEEKKTQRPSAAPTVITVDDDSENDQETWKEIARALDRIFFWLFLALFAVSSVVIYSQAGRLATIDEF